MDNRLVAVVLAFGVVACGAEGEEDSELGTDADTSMDTEAEGDSDTDQEVDTEVVHTLCEDPLPGGAMEGSLFDTEDVLVGEVRVSDRCEVTVSDLDMDLSSQVYPAIGLFRDNVMLGELWIEPRVYDLQDMTLPLFVDDDGRPLWDGTGPLTFYVYDALLPIRRWASADLQELGD